MGISSSGTIFYGAVVEDENNDNKCDFIKNLIKDNPDQSILNLLYEFGEKLPEEYCILFSGYEDEIASIAISRTVQIANDYDIINIDKSLFEITDHEKQRFADYVSFIGVDKLEISWKLTSEYG